MAMPRQVAVAMGYQPGTDLAPKVLASGIGPLAERILEIAVSKGVPVQEDAELADLLAKMPLAQEIPPDLYPAVAEIFAFLFNIHNKLVDESLPKRD